MMKAFVAAAFAAACLSAWAVSTASARALHNPVSVTVSGPGKVTGSGDGGAIDCPTQCFAQIRQNTSITLTETPSGGAEFAGRGGDCASSGTGAQCTITA